MSGEFGRLARDGVVMENGEIMRGGAPQKMKVAQDDVRVCGCRDVGRGYSVVFWFPS